MSSQKSGESFDELSKEVRGLTEQLAKIDSRIFQIRHALPSRLHKEVDARYVKPENIPRTRVTTKRGPTQRRVPLTPVQLTAIREIKKLEREKLSLEEQLAEKELLLTLATGPRKYRYLIKAVRERFQSVAPVQAPAVKSSKKPDPTRGSRQKLGKKADSAI